MAIESTSPQGIARVGQIIPVPPLRESLRGPTMLRRVEASIHVPADHVNEGEDVRTHEGNSKLITVDPCW